MTRVAIPMAVLEKVDSKLIARHRLLSIRHLANAAIKLPLDFQGTIPRIIFY
jgi:hypothetical protein